MANRLRVTVEEGPKGKKFAAVAPDWPGLERGGKTAAAAVEALETYVARYAAIADLAGMAAEYAKVGTVEVVERYQGPGSTDFWGISFGFSDIDRDPGSSADLARRLALMQSCWTYFDGVRARVSAEMRKGPRGGGRDRDRIVQHVLGVEQDWGEEGGCPHAGGRGRDGRRGCGRLPQRVLRGDLGLPRRGQDCTGVADPVPGPPHRLPHHGPCMGDGGQGPDRHGLVTRGGRRSGQPSQIGPAASDRRSRERRAERRSVPQLSATDAATTSRVSAASSARALRPRRTIVGAASASLTVRAIAAPTKATAAAAAKPYR